MKGSQEFGIEGYFLPKAETFYKPLYGKILPGKRKTYIDEEV
jgi:hypothetical protein